MISWTSIEPTAARYVRGLWGGDTSYNWWSCFGDEQGLFLRDWPQDLKSCQRGHHESSCLSSGRTLTEGSAQEAGAECFDES